MGLWRQKGVDGHLHPTLASALSLQRWRTVFHVRLDLSSPSLQELLEQGEAKRGARGGDHVACITHAPLTETENPGYVPMHTNALCSSWIGRG
jgi:hypothetical protein